MIGKFFRASSFTELGDYLATGRDGTRQDRVGWYAHRGNVPSEFDIQTASMLMNADFRERGHARMKEPVLHFILSAAPEDKDKLTQEQWEDIVDGLLEEFNLTGHDATMVKHVDKEHYEHIHVMASALTPQGKAWRRRPTKPGKAAGAGDYRWKARMDEYLRGIEKKHVQLRELDTPLKAEREGRKWTKTRRKNRAEAEVDARTGRTKLFQMAADKAETLIEQIKPSFAEARSWAELEQFIKASGNLAIQTRGKGLVLVKQDGSGAYIKLSSLGSMKFDGADKSVRINKNSLAKQFGGQTFEEYEKARQTGQGAQTGSSDAACQADQPRTPPKPKPTVEQSEETPDTPLDPQADVILPAATSLTPPVPRWVPPPATGAENPPESVSGASKPSYVPIEDVTGPLPAEPTPEAWDPQTPEVLPVQQFGMDEQDVIRDRLGYALRMASNWDEMRSIALRLSLQIVSGSALRSRDRYMLLTQIDSKLTHKRLAERFGETWSGYKRRMVKGLTKGQAKAEQRFKPHKQRDRGRGPER